MQIKIPYAFDFLYAAILIIIFQVAIYIFIPPLSFLLIFIWMPFWPIILFHICMFCLVYDALSQKISRKWLLAPLTFYSGYYLSFAYEYIALNSITAYYQDIHKRARFDFTVKTHDLIFISKNIQRDTVSTLLKKYDISKAYIKYNNSEKILFAAGRKFDASACKALMGLNTEFSNLIAREPMEPLTFANKNKDLPCIAYIPDYPEELPVIIHTPNSEKKRMGITPVKINSVVITYPDESSFPLYNITAERLYWLPFFIAGCEPLFEKKCLFRWARNKSRSITEQHSNSNFPLDALAQALQLPHANQTDNLENRLPALPLTWSKFMENVSAKHFENLGQLIENPNVKMSFDKLNAVTFSPKTLRNYSDGLFTALQTAAERNQLPNADIIASLFSYAALNNYHKYGSGIFELYDKAEANNWLWRSKIIIEVLPELGEDAFPYLSNENMLNGENDGVALKIVCTIAARIRPYAETRVRALWDDPTITANPTIKKRLYVTLKRMGIEPYHAELQAFRRNRDITALRRIPMNYDMNISDARSCLN